MAHDFKRKEPTKTEKVLYELFVQQQGMERNLVTNSALLVSLAMLLKIEPEKLAEQLLDNDKVKAYSDKINKRIDEMETERRAKAQPAAVDAGEQAPAPASEPADEHAGHNHA